MATSKVQIPQPAIFQSDPEQQIYARGTMDRDMSGLAYMFKNAADTRRERDQDTYMQGVSEANRIAAALEKQDMMQRTLLEALKQAPDYAKAGLPIADVPMLAQLFASGGAGQAAEASSLVNELKKSEIAKNAAAGAASGQAGAPEYTEEMQITPSGVSVGTMRVKTKGGDSKVAQEILRQRGLAALAARGITGGGPGGTGLPQANPVDVSRTQEYNRGRWGN